MYFWIRRAHSVIGVILPLMFAVIYLVPFSMASGGAAAFNDCMSVVNSLPLYTFFEFVLFLLLIVHTIMMLLSVYGSSINVVSHSHYSNWIYAIRRLAGVVLVPFMIYFIFVTRMSFAFSKRHLDYIHMQRLLSSSWIEAFCIVGVVSMFFYMMTSATTVLSEWGVTVSRRSRNAVSMVMWIVAIVMAGWGVKVLLMF